MTSVWNDLPRTSILWGCLFFLTCFLHASDWQITLSFCLSLGRRATAAEKLAHAKTSMGSKHQVLMYVEYRAVSGVFQNIDPHPLSTQRVCPSPAQKGGGVHTRQAVRGWGVNILEDGRHYFGLLQYNLSTVLNKFSNRHFQRIFPDTQVVQNVKTERGRCYMLPYILSGLV